jgi:hypothetical protein
MRRDRTIRQQRLGRGLGTLFLGKRYAQSGTFIYRMAIRLFCLDSKCREFMERPPKPPTGTSGVYPDHYSCNAIHINRNHSECHRCV